MFSFGRILKSCSGGCQLLWSDPNKQAGAYGAVNKDDKEDIEEPDLEPLSPSDIVFSQPGGGRRASWSLDLEDPIYRNPIVKNSSKTSSLERNKSFSGNSSAPIVKMRTPPRDAFTISNSPIVKNKTPPRRSTADKSSSIVKSKIPPKSSMKSSTSLNKVSETDGEDKLLSASTPNLSSKQGEYGPTVHSSKSSKKVKKTNSEIALQVVSVV